MRETAGFILAGGKSRRMGENKAFLLLEGKTFLERVQEALAEFDQIYLSVDRREAYEHTGLTLVADRYPDRGPIGGICTGLLLCPEPALFVAACDMPYLDQNTVEILLNAYQREGKTVVAKTGKRIHPLLGVYPREVLPVMKEMVEKGACRMMDFLDRVDHTAVEIGDAALAAVNVNSREMYDGMKDAGKLPSVEEAAELLKQYAVPVSATEEIPLTGALGRVLAEDAEADRDQPPFPRSPLDGYALRAADTENAGPVSPVCLKVVGEICAGQVYSGRIERGQALRIMTGAPIPCGADTVVKQEHTDYGEKQVKIYESLKPFSNYCPAGEDYRAGDILLKKGTRLDGISIGILAGMGAEKVRVRVLPAVGVISTGDELCRPGRPLPPGKIYDSNRYLIQARMCELGLPPAFSMNGPDDAKILAEVIREKARAAQLIITTGGVSVGKKDIMHEVIRELGAERLFWKVALKPGSPVLAALYGKTLLICLSGNPFGAAANFELLVRPVIAELTGDPSWEMRRRSACFHGTFAKKSARRRFLRAYYEEGQVQIPEQKEASGILSTFAGCNCLIDIEAGNQGLKEGDRVWVYLM